MRRLFLISLSVVCLSLLDASAGAEVVDSIFIGNVGLWDSAANWYPAEIPNNLGAKRFNVRLPYPQITILDKDVTITNLTLESRAVLQLNGAALSVLGTTTNGADIGRDDEDDHGIRLENGAILNAGSLASFANGTLSGCYRLFGGTAARNTTLRFNGADIRKLSSGVITIDGAFVRILDENGLDALRNFNEIGAGSRFNILGRTFLTPGDFTNFGTLNVGALAAGDPVGGAALFKVAGKLTNFDPTSRTLGGGSYRMSSYQSDSDSTIQFAGADIVNNGALIFMEGAHSRIVDEFGNDALRHFAHNLAGGSFEAREGFTTEGDFTNDGVLHASGPFKITGRLTNFVPATRTLAGGTYVLSGQGALQVPGIDIVHNAASLVIDTDDHPVWDEFGNDGLRNLADNGTSASLTIESSAELDTVGDFTNAGTVTIGGFTGPQVSSYGLLKLPPGARYLQTAGSTVLEGRLVAEIVAIQKGTLSGHGGGLGGNVEIGEATFAPVSRVDVAGTLTLSPQSHFRATIGYYPTEVDVEGTATKLDGILEVSMANDMHPGRAQVFPILFSFQTDFSGTFTNVGNGQRLLTTDGKGSFRVDYHPRAIYLSDYEAVPPPAQLLNISTRAQVLTSDNAVIAGFIITGSVPKTVAMRGIGPSLAGLGVTGTLQDPTLQLIDSTGAVVSSNNNWADNQRTQIEQARLAPGDAREAALIATLNPGSFTVVLRGAGDTTGVAVVEVYDLSAAKTSKIANISTRARVGTNSNVLIGGFIAGGEGPGQAEVVIRAEGPELGNLNVKDYLPDTMLELRDSNGALIMANDDRPSDGGYLGLEPFDYRSSIVRAAVPAGNYTAVVRGKGGTEGVATVEVYDIND